MNLKQQIVSLELAQKLRQLGIEQDSHFFWEGRKESSDFQINSFAMRFQGEWVESYSAFTVSELGEFLKPHKEILEKIEEPRDLFFPEDVTAVVFEPDYWARVLIYLIENKLIEVTRHPR